MRPTMTLPSALLLASAFLLAGNCSGDDSSKTPKDTQPEDTWQDFVDADGDGVTEADGDCDDNDPNVFPGNEEDCNGADENCNGVIDEGYSDTDRDGLADCVDSEECDGVDNDGDGSVDEGFADSDGDGIPDCQEAEVCDGLDNDGDGDVDEDFDADHDSYTSCGSETEQADCDDSDPSVNPGAAEVPNDRVDNDCDGLVDEGLWAAGDLAIVEVMTNPLAVSDSDGEWFEVFNATDRLVFLNGLVITSTVDADYHVVRADELIELGPGEVVVFGSNEDSAVNGDVSVDYVYTDVIFSNESDDLVLMAGDLMLDQVTWDDGATMPDVAGASMTLDPWIYLDTSDYVPAVANDDPANWCDAIESWATRSDFGSPGERNEYCHSWDHDGDGFSADDGDCDDGDATVYPGAPEIDPTKDNDCDGEVEWMPTAVADYDAVNSSLLTCNPLYLVGTGSFDPEGQALTYAWTVEAVPTGSSRSTADLHTSTDASPTFFPDVAGEYTFGLMVNDGGCDSFQALVTVLVGDRGSNVPPVASAGPDQSTSYTQSCPLTGYSYVCSDCPDYDFAIDGSGSGDVDDLDLTYAWTVTSGTATLSDSTVASPTVTMTGLTCTYGSTTTYTVELSLTVTDCPGSAATDTVTLTYDCIGT